MNLGAFVAQIWLEVRPIRRWKAKRAAKKAAKHPEAASSVNGEYFNEAQEGGGMSEPKLRTSTKAGAAGLATLLGSAAVMLPFYSEINGYLLQACSSDQGPLAFLASGALVLVVTWVTARRAKTATKPGIL